MSEPVTIDVAPSGMLRVSFARDHWADIPATATGVAYLIDMLQARHRGELKIAQAGAPTQAQIDEFMKRKAQREREALGLEPVNLEELGL